MNEAEERKQELVKEELKEEINDQDIRDFQSQDGHEKVIDLIVKKDDVTWKTIILELVNSNRMDPWNINLRLLTKEYLKIIKKLKQHDFRISGKIILAAAMLLKLKSARLLEGDINELDRLLTSTQEEEENDLGLVDEVLPNSVQDMEPYKLIPRTPQPRKRKVSIYDLVDALEKALEVKERRVMKRMPGLELEIPQKPVDVSILMSHLYDRINHLFAAKKKNKVYFDDLVPSSSKEDKIVTFIPLLHLTNQRRVDLDQEIHFGPIEVMLNKNSEMQKEIEEELEESEE